ncbi:MAG: hypothetical protein PHE18_08050, partial [Candidatus Omnitrophica bacterium]|nr:hypothetical protein [Candidatus Omnitrophota bacterium]
VVDVVYAKIQEGLDNLNDDISLGGINASYALTDTTTLEGYLFSKITDANNANVFNLDGNSAAVPVGIEHKSDMVNTVGIRAVDRTLPNLTLDGQIAYQFGRYNPRFDANANYDATGPSGVTGARMHKRSAWAAQVKAAYDLKDVDMVSAWTPMVYAGYTYLSGADRDQGLDESYKGWDPMFENQTEGHLINAIFANTNTQQIALGASAKLTEDLTANLDYVTKWFARNFPENTLTGRRVILSGIYGATAATSGRVFRVGEDKFIGQEIDAKLTYDYTEDVQFGLMGGILLLSDNVRADVPSYPDAKNKKGSATELIGSMKVTF